jgi:HPt (histidine-containing phosphotransfer) domain-containing protein
MLAADVLPTDEGERLVDPDVLRELTEFRVPGEPDPVEDVVELFLELTPARLTELGQAAAAGDRQAVQALAHTIKGSAGTVGAQAVRAAAAAVEEAAEEDAVRGVSHLADVFDRTRPAITALVAALRPAG